MTDLLSQLLSFTTPPAQSQYRHPPKKVAVRSKARPRDTQKSRVYKAENTARKAIAATGVTWDMDPGDITTFVVSMQQTRWWKAQGYPLVMVARNYRGRTTSRGGNRVIRIASDSWHHNTWVVLHEMAHAVLPLSHLHGPMFARTLLAMVGRFMGKAEADALRAAFVAGKVRHRVSANV